nr:MAG TPA: chromosome partitioning protein [Caudoviricetes sp.]
MAKFTMLDILNAQSKNSTSTKVESYTEIYLNPKEVKPSATNFYSQNDIEELADSFLTVGQQQPTVLARINNEYRIVSGHRRNLANCLLLDRGHNEYERVRYLYKDMTEATFELSLLVGNAFNRELTAYEKMEQAARLKKALIRAKEEDGLEIQGRMRDIIAETLKESTSNIARMEQINNNLSDSAKEQFKNGNMGITAAYETSKLTEDEQEAIADRYASGEDVRAKEIAEKVTEKKAAEKAKKEEAKEKENVAADEYRTPHPESITSLCYSCLNYSTCNVKTSTCKKCDEYINKAEAEKTDEQRYNEEQDRIDRETKRKLQERDREKALDKVLQPREKKVHELKLSALFYEDVARGRKRFELCKNDHNIKVGDKVRLNECRSGDYTGRYIEAEIVYKLENYSGLEGGYCILGIDVINVFR